MKAGEGYLATTPSQYDQTRVASAFSGGGILLVVALITASHSKRPNGVIINAGLLLTHLGIEFHVGGGGLNVVRMNL